MKWMPPNIDAKGRAARAFTAFLLAGAAVALWPFTRVLSALLAVSAIFVAFEAARGWCALRACGIKTKI